jgi:hypothetical protein
MTVVDPDGQYADPDGHYADPDGDLVPDESPIQMRRELRRLVNSRARPSGPGQPPAFAMPASGGQPTPEDRVGADSQAGPVARPLAPGPDGSSWPVPPAPGAPAPSPNGPIQAGIAGPSAPLGPLRQPSPAASPTSPPPLGAPPTPGSPPPPSPGGPHPPPGTPPLDDSGRHVRRTAPIRRPPGHYVPKHAMRTPGPASVSPTEVTEVFSRVRQDPTERPMPARPESEPFPVVSAPLAPLSGPPSDSATVAEPKAAEPPSGKRERVVLSQRKGTTRPVRMVVDVQELTQVGEVLSTSLIRSQLALALRIGGIALIALGSLPAMFVIFPVLGRFELFGLRLPWLLLGVLAYPFLLVLAWMYSRSAERIEQVFADHIQS